jgi:O-methyltransferase involved in polyketide biosynthesis
VPDVGPDLPHRARILNYWLGGKDHYAADRNSADAISATFPGAAQMVRAALRFDERAAQHLAAEHGIRQFLDIGSGLPVDRDLQAALRDIAPDARIVHLDHDPFVLVRARTLPGPDERGGVAVYRAADFRDPAAVLAAAADVLDLSRPVAVLFAGMLGYLRSPDDAARIVREVVSGLVAGSFLAVWDLVPAADLDAQTRSAICNPEITRYDVGSVPDLRKLFAGLDLVGPGIVPVAEWLPSGDSGGVGPGSPVDAHGGVARIPVGGQPPAPPAGAEPIPQRAPESPTGTGPIAVLGGEPPSVVHLHTDVPVPARVWNYWLGGKDHYAADRALGDAVIGTYPEVHRHVVASRGFLVRAVAHLAESGIRQYLDIGCGLPAGRNTHEIAQSILPDARVVYVDNDPQVLIHSRARLTGAPSSGVVTYVEADYRDPHTVLARAATTLDMRRPVAALFMGVLGHVDVPEMHRAVRTIVAALAPGSYLALWDSTDTSDEIREAATVQAGMGIPYRLSTVADLEGCFTGLELVAPGLVPTTAWRPDPDDAGPIPPVDAYGAVGRKP